MGISGWSVVGLLSLVVSNCCKKKKATPGPLGAEESNEMGPVRAPDLTKELPARQPLRKESKPNEAQTPNDNNVVEKEATVKSEKKNTSMSQLESDAVSQVPSILALSPEWSDPNVEPLVLLPIAFQLPPTDTSKHPHKSASKHLTKHQPSDKHRDRPTEASQRNRIPS